MAAKKLKTKIRREQIAQAALDIVSTGGLKQLSVAEVALRIGLVPSALYRHVKKKDDILTLIDERIESKLLANVAAVCEQTDDPLERLHQLFLRHIRLISENRGIPVVIFSQDFHADNLERKTRICKMISSYLKEVAALLKQAQAGGHIAKSVDIDAAAMLFLGLIQPPMILWHLSEGDFDVQRHAKSAWPLFLKAIK
ncbi:Fatty acid metabolism regulator protein [Limihaloglobus sulfuriphilus]|uniref:Fatty acid metabolism regulator protein n=1 Tax=Limihaloglobus sulfuriphilus TaxID=1851148 RepID=A0A1Q2MHT3_9BACT|nr:TetR/AcrR family transcriptional regulator [Limihaloglobus sulfuriphilus]AQQ72214.1 Fatty acid metabolism regulator protein [Limihaloglobus sulfuriphilus]